MLKLLYWLGKYRDAAILMLIGVLAVTYSFDQLLSSIRPLLEEMRSTRESSSAETLLAERRANAYTDQRFALSDQKYEEVLRGIGRLESAVAGTNRRLDEVLQGRPKSSAKVLVREETTKN